WLVRVALLLLLFSRWGGGQDPPADAETIPTCPCNATSPASCTAADTAANASCSAVCEALNLTAGFYVQKAGDTTGQIKCEVFTTTVAPTTVKGGVGGGGTDGNETTPDKNNTIITPDRCETGVLKGTKLLVSKIFSYLSFAWILIWVLATMIVNSRHKNKGHHRWLQLFEEIFILILWLFMGIFNLTFKTSADMCKATAIVIHIVIVILAAALVFEAIFADAMVHNKSFINGKIPPFLNYILPILIGLIPGLVTYFVRKNEYLTGLHCFAEVPFEMFWGFVIPVFVLLYIAGLKASLGNLACDQTDEDVQDEDQIFWAKKSCKALFFFAFNLLTCYLLCLFASSQQRMIIFILFFLNTLLFGPIIFITHTYCHRNSQRKLHGGGLIGRFYKPCPPKPEVVVPVPTPAPVPLPPKKKKTLDKNTQTTEPEVKPEEKKPEPAKPTPAPANHPPSQPVASSPPPPPPADAGPPPEQPSWAGIPSNRLNDREFYGWVGGKNKYDQSQDALFMPKPT
ncbi:hypothetical protein PMAYCL1PPCAC_32616, partial [Pristionchus mayeri]